MTTSGPIPHSLANDFRPCLGFPLSMPEPLKNGDSDGMAGGECKISPVSSPGALSVVSSPALPTESATATSPPANKSENPAHHQVQDMEDNSLVRGIMCSASERSRLDELGDPLAQLQNALEKNGMLGRKLEVPRLLSPVAVTKDDYHASPDIEKQLIPYTTQEADVTGEVFRCHICSYTSTSKFHFNSHMNTHFDHKCPFCDYTSRTEGRLKRHVKDFHSEIPPESWAGTRIPREDGCDSNSNGSSNGKARNYRCKQCNYVAFTKNEFWEHNKSHIKAEKLLTCPKCPFVTEYKHHLEYHLRNHFGSKPFKCNKCNYSCVNKSMLNSHMKSHSNVYQYRCSDCNYATKYCHSLKLHLRKYNHKPASVLNTDGSPNPFPIIDVYGSRRGPRPKKQKHDDSNSLDSNSLSPIGHIHNQAPPMGGYPNIPPMISTSMGLPFLYPSHLINNFQNNIFLRPPMLGPHFRPALMPPEHPESVVSPPSNGEGKRSTPFKCNLCEFGTETKEIFTKHILLHAASENQDLCNLYGISTDSLAFEHAQNVAQQQRDANIHQKSQPLDLKGNFNRSESQLFVNDDNNCASHMDDDVFEDREDCSSSQSTEDGTDYQNVFNSTSNVSNQEKEIVHERSSSGGCDLSPLSSLDEDIKDVAPCRKTESSYPLDLSSHRDSLSSTSPTEKRTATESQMEAGSNNQNNIVPLSRNRRKGKAFKLNRICIRLKDQTSSYADQMDDDDEDYPMQNSCLADDFSEGMDCDFGQQPSANNGDFSPPVQVKVPNYSVSGNGFTKTQPPFEIPKQVPKPQPSPPSPNDVLFRLHALANNPSDRTQPSPPVVNEERKPDSVNSKTHNDHHVICRSSPTSNKSPVSEKLSPLVCFKENEKELEDEDTQLNSKLMEAYTCNYCDMSFKDCVMYTVHMGYHGYQDPFKCNMCGQQSKDKVGFFLHIARAAHL